MPRQAIPAITPQARWKLWQATSIQRTVGRTRWSRSWPGIGASSSAGTFAPMPPLPILRSMSSRRLQVRDPAACQSDSSTEDRLLAQAPCWPSSERVRAVRGDGSYPNLASILREGRKNASIHAGSRAIRGIPVKVTRVSEIKSFAGSNDRVGGRSGIWR